MTSLDISTTGTQNPEKKPSLGPAFKKAWGYARSNWQETAAISTAVLLGSTGLVTPALTAAAQAPNLLNMGAALALGAGSIALIKSTSGALVDSVEALGKKSGAAAITMGLVLGALTSFPELFVSTAAALSGQPDIAIGNIVGSNIANPLLILGAAAGAYGAGKLSGMSWKFNTASMLGATALFSGLLANNMLSPATGLGLLGVMGAWLGGTYYFNKKDAAAGVELSEDEHKAAFDMPGTFNAAWGAAGLAGLVFAARLLVDSASAFSVGAGIDPAKVATIAVAFGTSVPELAVTMDTLKRSKPALAMGNIVGSNIFNILMVGGMSAALAGMPATSKYIPHFMDGGSPLGTLTQGAFLASAAATAAVMWRNGGGVKKWQGYAGAALYAAFTVATGMLSGEAKPVEPAQNTRPAIVQTVSTPARRLPELTHP